MINDNLENLLKEVLSNDERFISEEGKILKNAVLQQAVKLDENLISLLLENKILEEKFFKEIKNIKVFNIQKFIDFINNKNFLPDSYTKFENKIGLTNNDGKFLANSKEIVLNFPFKDCILAGGQDNEDVKRDEIFYNEILGSDEIDRLLDEKVFTNFKRIDKNGEYKLESFKKNENGNIKDNLIIKGNNLLVLHSLKNFKGKVKLIYIDPPYNTGNDGFKYNDKFNHSTWLTFMKNRLEIAKELLRDDGVIFVQCDDNEQAYLKVLMDEIFGRENFISNSTILINRGGRDYGGIAKTHEYLLVYSKQKLQELNFIEEKDKKFDYEDESGGFNLMELRNRNVLFNDKNRPNLFYSFYVNPNKKDDNGLLEISLENKEGYIEVSPLKSQGIQTVWRWGKDKSLENLNIQIKGKEKQDGGFMIVQKYRNTTKRQRSIWDDKEFVNERGSEHIKKLFDGKVFAYPKSEYLISRVIELGSDIGDIVLDYHLGSGTTCAVAHKMLRQYIGIEQMDYIETISVERLKKVIDGEQGGISKNVERNGGGDFVYMELSKDNQIYIERIEKAENIEELIEIYEELKNSSFINYQINISDIDKNISDFKEFSLEQAKEFLIKIIDKNLLYKNYSEMHDKNSEVSGEDKKLNDDFYKN